MTSLSPKKPRLLYRGCLSLPDSHVLLDGLTFFATPAPLNTPNPNGSPASPSPNLSDLLENPLALALESMRGIQSLNLIGTVKMKDIWMDDSGGVRMDIHPYALISRIYFENMFCIGNSAFAGERSMIGVKVALGDGDDSGVGLTEIIIYATKTTTPDAIELRVSRLVPAPIRPSPRPRPDDPTPRKPEILLLRRTLERGLSRGQGPRSSLTRTQSESSVLGSQLRLGGAAAGTFKVPEVPAGKGKNAVAAAGKSRTGKKQADNEMAAATADVFGSTSNGAGMEASASTSSSAKRKRDSGDDDDMEAANKVKIKRHTQDTLTTPPHSLAKTSAEFKEVFGWIYRGTAFALRTEMTVRPVDMKAVDRLVRAHIALYCSPGSGDIG